LAGKNALLRLKNGLEWLQKRVCLLEECLLSRFEVLKVALDQWIHAQAAIFLIVI
jgi:hypothetical protein